MPSSFTSIHIHAVWATAHRTPWLAPHIREELFPYTNAILQRLGCQVVAMNGVEDHVHLLFWMHPTLAPAALMKEIKGSTTPWIRRQFGLPEFPWQDGYAAFAVSPERVSQVRSYIARQEEHHRKVSPRDELRALFLEHGIEFKEEYLR
jgi:putative transposase